MSDVRHGIQPGSALFHEGMREHDERLCWRILDGGRRLCIQDRGHDNGVHEHENEPSLELAVAVLPPGYAIWTYGQGADEGLDELVISKEPEDA